MTNVVSIAQSGANNVTMRNRIINGGMAISQRGTSFTQDTTGTQFSLDRWNIYGTAAGKFTAQQTPSETETGFATRVNAGFTNYLGITSTSAYSVISSDIFQLQQSIEGFNTADLAWGTSNAKTVTLSFLAYSSLTGTFGGAIVNSSVTRSYPFTYTISSANTWTTVSITIPGDTTGTWVGATNGIGMRVYFGLGMGSSKSGTAGVWASADYRSATGAVSVVGTNGATFYITGVQLEKGSTATPFEQRLYGTELALCQRYCYRIQNSGVNTFGFGSMILTYTATRAFGVLSAPAPMRASPAITFSGVNVFTPSFGGVAITAIGVYQAPTFSSKEYYVEFNAASGFTGACLPYLSGSTSSFIQLEAEL